MSIELPDIRKLDFGAIIKLYEIDLTSLNNNDPLIYRISNSSDKTGNIFFGGHEYFQVPIREYDFDYNNSGKEPEPRVEIGNVGDIFTPLTIQFNDFKGATIRRIVTFERYLDGRDEADNTKKLSDDVWTIDQKISGNQISLSFQLNSPIQSDRAKMGRQLLKYCSRTYRIFKNGSFDYTGVNCPYVGEKSFKKNGASCSPIFDSCGKTIGDCKIRGVDKFFKGFSNVKRQQ